MISFWKAHVIRQPKMKPSFLPPHNCWLIPNSQSAETLRHFYLYQGRNLPMPCYVKCYVKCKFPFCSCTVLKFASQSKNLTFLFLDFIVFHLVHDSRLFIIWFPHYHIHCAHHLCVIHTLVQQAFYIFIHINAKTLNISEPSREPWAMPQRSQCILGVQLAGVIISNCPLW